MQIARQVYHRQTKKSRPRSSLMFDIKRSPTSITFRSDCMETHRSAVVAASKTFLQTRGAPEGAATMVVFRELLSNAITHGNRNADERCVSARIEHVGGVSFAVTVQDNGEGFDYERAANGAVPEDPRRALQRGYFLIRSLSNRIAFSEKGNSITAYVTENGQV
jgi:anti-sigma regulatory factor (Ser/Thr protein kinase)